MYAYLHDLVTYIGEHPHIAIVVVFLFSMGEAIFVLGLFVPSTAVLVGAGTLIGLGNLNFLPIFLATAIGAFLGDAISYWIGQYYKEHIREVWPFSRYTHWIDKGEKYFANHGGKSVFIGRFIPGIKAIVPGVAGIAGMDPRYFTLINFSSSLVWAAAHILPGMGIGQGFEYLIGGPI